MSKTDQIFNRDGRIVEIREYLDGWAPNSYRWPAPGKFRTTRRNGVVYYGTYDRKRSHGRGPSLVAFSARGGRLYSE